MTERMKRLKALADGAEFWILNDESDPEEYPSFFFRYSSGTWQTATWDFLRVICEADLERERCQALGNTLGAPR